MDLNFELTKNFKLKEFLTNKFFDKISQNKALDIFKNNIELHFNVQKLASNLQVLRNELNCPIKINIAYRPVFWELKQERSGNSKHTLCIAADIVVKKFTTKELKDIIENLIIEGKMSEGGLGIYNSFIHYDIRGSKARWDER
jgi:uncharacterized protein YcbK (DUF882 family)